MKKIMESLNGKVGKVAIGVALTATLTLCSFTLREVYDNNAKDSALVQMVQDGKENRNRAEITNSEQHKQIMEELKNLVPRQEYNLRTSQLELRMREIELQIKELQVRITALELQVAEVKGKVKP